MEDPVEESEAGGESAMLEGESSSTGPQSQGASGLAAGEAEHTHEIQRQNREMMIAMISMLGCVGLGIVIYPLASRWAADHNKLRK